jgi:hypothetical protein
MRRFLPFLLLFAVAVFIGNVQAQVNEPFSGIRIVSPANGAIFKAPANIVIMVNGYDNPSIGHVIRLYEGSTLLHVIVLDPLIPITTVPVEFNFDFNWDNVRAGHDVLTASIDDVVSEPVNITVKRKRTRHR